MVGENVVWEVRASRWLVGQVREGAESAVRSSSARRSSGVEVVACRAHHVGRARCAVVFVASAFGGVFDVGVVAVCNSSGSMIWALGCGEEVDCRDMRLVCMRAELLVGEQRVDRVCGRHLLLCNFNLVSLGGSGITRVPRGRACLLFWGLALALVQLRDDAIAQFIQVDAVTSVSGLAVAVNTSGACGVCDAKLIGVEEKGIGVCDIELLLFAHETSTLAGDVLHQSFAEGGGQLVEFFLCKINTEIMFPALSFQDVVVAVLQREKKSH